MREKCELDDESSHDGMCRRCRKISNNPRSWGVPCSRIGLDKRIKFLIPAFLADQLSGDRIRSFFKEHTHTTVPGSTIKLHLTAGFGNSLVLDAIQIVPRGHESIRMRGIDRADNGSAPIVRLNSPPVVPTLTDRHKIQKHFSQWLDSAIEEAGSSLPQHCFPGAHEYWENRMLTIICEYYQTRAPKSGPLGSAPYDTLRRALKLLVLSDIMCNAFKVPKEDAEKLYSQLQGNYAQDPDQDVCPRLANRFIKSLLLPMLNKMAKDVLRSLHKLLRKRGHDDSLWDPLFCILFLCLIVLGKFQIMYVERAELGLANHDYSVTREDAVFGVKEMEGELCVHLIGQFHARFGTNRKGNGNGKPYNPLSRDRATGSAYLAEPVSFATQTYGMVFRALRRHARLLIRTQVNTSTTKKRYHMAMSEQ
jgi:hypothetical protein